MNETMIVDGNTLNIKRKYCITEENGKIRFEECYIISKNGTELMRCPVRQKNILLGVLRGNADLDYYQELKNKESN